MHRNCIHLLGSDQVFSGVIWREEDNSAEDTAWKIQSLLDAAYQLCEGQTGGDHRAAEVMVDNYLNQWQRTGMVDLP
jgi:hypothetical protein